MDRQQQWSSGQHFAWIEREHGRSTRAGFVKVRKCQPHAITGSQGGRSGDRLHEKATTDDLKNGGETGLHVQSWGSDAGDAAYQGIQPTPRARTV